MKVRLCVYIHNYLIYDVWLKYHCMAEKRWEINYVGNKHQRKNIEKMLDRRQKKRYLSAKHLGSVFINAII